MRTKQIISKIRKDKNSNFIFFLLMVLGSGIFFYLDRPTINSKKDIIEINGTLDKVEQVLIDIKKIKKAERDSAYHIHLKEFPSKFQVSYFPYDRIEFYKTSKQGDSIRLHIAKEDKAILFIQNKRIRSFSLTVNSRIYLSLENGLSGFGKGIFELFLIFAPLIVIIIMIIRIIKKK